MKRFPELKPNFWDVIVVLAVIALAALSAMTVWRGGTETGALTAVVTADGQEIDRFAPADLPHLFHRFYRGTGTGNTTGYGIGLSLCKTIITQQGGQITADNHPQGGAVFTIRFPK